MFSLFISIALLASIPLFMLATISRSLKEIPRFKAFLDAFDIHQLSFILLAISTLFIWAMRSITPFGISQSAWIQQLWTSTASSMSLLFITLFAKQLHHGKLSALKEYSFCYLKIMTLCMLTSLPYWIIQTPENHYFIPSINNNDVFAYLYRSSSFIPWQKDLVASMISGNTLYQITEMSSKFASAIYLSLFKALTSNPGLAAASAMVAVIVSITHLFWHSFKKTNNKKFLSINSFALLIFLMSIPALQFIGIRYHLSQGLFIYTTGLSMLTTIKLNQRHSLANTLFYILSFLYILILYPVALILFSGLTIATLGMTKCINNRSTFFFWLPRLIFFAITAYLLNYLFGDLLFTGRGELEEHLNSPYYSLPFIPFIALLLAPISLNNGSSFVVELSHLKAALFDGLLASAALIAILKWKNHHDRKVLLQSLTLISIAMASYVCLYCYTDGNYRAFKFCTTVVTLIVLFTVTRFFGNTHFGTSHIGTCILLLITITNLSSIQSLTFGRSFPPSYSKWIDHINQSSEKEIYYDFYDYKINMYLPMLVPGKSLNALGNSYFTTNLKSKKNSGDVFYYTRNSPKSEHLEIYRVRRDGTKEKFSMQKH